MNSRILAILLLACLMPAGAFAQDKKSKDAADINMGEALKCVHCGGEVGLGQHCSATGFISLCSAVREKLNTKIEAQKNKAVKERTRLDDLIEQVIEHAYKEDYEYVRVKKDDSNDPHSWYAAEIENILTAAGEEAKFILKMEKSGVDVKDLIVRTDIIYNKLKKGEYAGALKKLKKADDELSKSALRNLNIRMRLEAMNLVKKEYNL
jgi:hypothetical protein